MKTMLPLLLFLSILSSSGKEQGSKVKAVPGIEVTVNSFYISRNEQGQHSLILSLDCFLKDKGSFTGSEGPHHLTLSTSYDTGDIDLAPENDQFSDPRPLAGQATMLPHHPLNSVKRIRNWNVRFHIPSFPLDPAVTKFRIKGTMAFYIVPSLHSLPPFDLLQSGKGYTRNIPLPCMKNQEGDIISSGTQDTAIFISSSPADDIALTLKYNPSLFQFAYFHLLDQQGRTAEAFPARFNFGFNDRENHEFAIKRQYYSKQDWKQLRVQLFYVDPEEARYVTVPVDMKVSLGNDIPAKLHSLEETSPSPPPPIKTQQAAEEPVRFHIDSIEQHRKKVDGGFFSVNPSTRIKLTCHPMENGPIPHGLSLEGTLLLQGNGENTAISLTDCFCEKFAFPDENTEGPSLCLEIPGLLPATSSCWTLSGSIKADMAGRIFRIHVPIPIHQGASVTVPLADIPPGLLPENTIVTLTVSHVTSELPDGPVSLLLLLHSSLPLENFGPLIVTSATCKNVYSPSPGKKEKLPDGVITTYDASWDSMDGDIPAELVLYINPHTVTMPLHLKFGAGGVIPSPDNNACLPRQNKKSRP